MEKNDVDKMIKQNLETCPPGMKIDIRRETMSRIEALSSRVLRRSIDIVTVVGA